MWGDQMLSITEYERLKHEEFGSDKFYDTKLGKIILDVTNEVVDKIDKFVQEK
jgi:hypothetical protein